MDRCLRFLCAPFLGVRMATVNYVQADEFEALLAGELLAVVDFTASWCGPCKLVAPLMEQLADSYEGRVAVAKVNIDDHKAIAKQFEVKSIPAVLMFKGGELVENLVGVKPYEEFSQAVDKHLA